MTNDDAARRRRTRTLLTALTGAVACAALALLGLQRSWRAGREGVLADLERDGLAVTPEALDPPAPAAAAGADLARLLGRLDDLPEPVQRVTEWGPRHVLDALADPTSLDAQAIYAPGPDDPPDLAGALALVGARLDPFEADLDRALAGPCELPVRWSEGLTGPAPDLAGVKRLALALRARAVGHAHAGRADAAWADVERALRLARAADGPWLIGRIMHDVLVEEGVAAVATLLTACGPPDADRLARLDAALAALDGAGGFARALRGELALTETTLEASGPEGAAARLLFARWRRDHTRLMADAIRAAAAPEAVDARSPLSELERRTVDASPLTQLVFPAVARLHSRDLAALALARAARAALSLAAADALPERPADLPRDPLDPAGGAIRWRRDGPRAATLWSVGVDGRDDGGRAPDRDAGEGLLSDGVDVVLRLALPAR
ncbi:MAG: hypothetical protein KF878_37365 [Planctomycetes bacterium]|nr:hypothetical protein [Planctomycetota bacterium]